MKSPRKRRVSQKRKTYRKQTKRRLNRKRRTLKKHKRKKKVNSRKNSNIAKNLTYKLYGGLKPTESSRHVNTVDPQLEHSGLVEFYQIMSREGIIYPPRTQSDSLEGPDSDAWFTFDSSILHKGGGNSEFGRYEIDYPITDIDASKNKITIDTSKRGIRGLTLEQTESIVTNVHKHHDYHPNRVQATLQGKTYFVTEIKENYVTLMVDEPIPSGTPVSGNLTISRNRKGDFIIYTSDPQSIRYLDEQAQVDFLERDDPPESKIGHYSLLKQSSDYDREVVRTPDEDDVSRPTDIILYAGTITWRHDGKALFYNNDCGRYQPDEHDSDYLARVNPEFDKTKETTTLEESGGDPKLFYRDHDHSSSLIDCEYCTFCDNCFSIDSVRRITERPKKYLYSCHSCYEYRTYTNQWSELITRAEYLQGHFLGYIIFHEKDIRSQLQEVKQGEGEKVDQNSMKELFRVINVFFNGIYFHYEYFPKLKHLVDECTDAGTQLVDYNQFLRLVRENKPVKPARE